MRSSSPFGGRVTSSAWFQSSERTGTVARGGGGSGRQGIEDRLKRHKAALLTDAAMSCDDGRVQELLAENADPNVADDRGRLPLHAASFAGGNEVLRRLLEARADANLPEQGQDGNRALQIAAWQGHGKVIALLLEHSADVEAVDERGWSPLCSAALQGHASIVKMLLKQGADPSRAVVVSGQGSMTPLQAAAKGRKLEVADVLKEALASSPASSPAMPRRPGARALQQAAEAIKQRLPSPRASPRKAPLASPVPGVGTAPAATPSASQASGGCFAMLGALLARCGCSCQR